MAESPMFYCSTHPNTAIQILCREWKYADLCDKCKESFKVWWDKSSASPIEQEPKTGHWIKVLDVVNEYGSETYHHECSECGSDKSGWGKFIYCPDCGAKMVEPQESEDKE